MYVARAPGGMVIQPVSAIGLASGVCGFAVVACELAGGALGVAGSAPLGRGAGACEAAAAGHAVARKRQNTQMPKLFMLFLPVRSGAYCGLVPDLPKSSVRSYNVPAAHDKTSILPIAQ